MDVLLQWINTEVISIYNIYYESKKLHIFMILSLETGQEFFVFIFVERSTGFIKNYETYQEYAGKMVMECFGRDQLAFTCRVN